MSSTKKTPQALFDDNDVQWLSSVFARFASCIDPKIMEYEAFLLISDYLYDYNLTLDSVPDLCRELKALRRKPKDLEIN